MVVSDLVRKKKIFGGFLLSLISILFLILNQNFTFTESENVLGSAMAEIESTGSYVVEQVVDGDTIKVWIDGELKTVRVANINTPETVDPRKPIECMGKEASEKMKELVENKQVVLETDQTQSEKDRYGRLIRFVFLPDGTDVGLKLISLGYAYATPYGSEPHQYFETYETAQREAEQNKLGLWSPELCAENSVF